VLKAILFDFDGTLVDSLTATFDSFNHGIMAVGGRRHSSAEITAHFGKGETEIFAELVGPDLAKAAYEAYSLHSRDSIARMPVHAGIMELLEHVHHAGLVTAIVTGRSWRTTEVIMRQHALMDRFACVIADDHVSRPKPSPEGILKALGHMGVDPCDAAYVGDTVVDIRAAKSAGCISVGAVWDACCDRAAVEAERPDLVAETPKGVRQLFGKCPPTFRGRGA